MKSYIKDYFTFNRKEQRGILVLLGILLALIIIYYFMPYFIADKEYDISSFKNEVEAFMAALAEEDSTNIQPTGSNDKYVKDSRLDDFLSHPYYFDPNTLSGEELLKIGINHKVTGNILKYRQKGGVFRKKEDFSRIYGMTDSIYQSLMPYITIKSSSYGYESNSKTDTKQVSFKYSDKYHINPEKTKFSRDSLPVNIELNSADSAALLRCTGIGPYFARKIIAYREKLGGFVKKEQLMEVYGMDSSRYSLVEKEILVDPYLVKKFDLNEVTFKELLKHPYFEYYMVKAIFSFRDNHERYDSVEQLKELPEMYDRLYEKISPYLMISPESGK